MIDDPSEEAVKATVLHSSGDENSLPPTNLEPDATLQVTEVQNLHHEVSNPSIDKTQAETVGGPLGRTLAEAGPSPLPSLPGYEILGELGRGGMGVVYRGRNLRLNRPCALKMILAGDTADSSRTARFLAEAEAVARLQHPHVVEIRHLGEAGRLPFIELELLQGGSLDRRLDGSPWPARKAATLVEPLALAVAEAHRVGIVHRDLKPANILLTTEGVPKVADFGLAKCLDINNDADQSSTQAILGSPCYMAPEQAEGDGRPIGPPADVYALGVILYELLTGRPPFRGASVLETLDQVRSTQPVRPSRLVPGIPTDVETIVSRCLQKEPGRRYESAAALAEDLGRFLQGRAIHARRTSGFERTWLWCRRNPALAYLTAASLALLLALATGSTVAAWMMAEQNQALRDERRRADRAEEATRLELVEAALSAAPEGVPYILASLRRNPRTAILPLRRILDDPEESPTQKLRAAEVLTLLDHPQPAPLLDALDFAPDAEAGLLISAFANLGPPVQERLTARLTAPGIRPPFRARLAIILLELGDPSAAGRMLAAGPDPLDRYTFLHTFPLWHGDLHALPAILRAVIEPDVRSGLLSALGQIDPRPLEAATRDALTVELRVFAREGTDPATHSAAVYALRRWGIEPAATPEANRPIAMNRWFVNRGGLTMLSLPAGAYFLGRGESSPGQPTPFAPGSFLSDREVTVAQFLRFLDDPDADKPRNSPNLDRSRANASRPASGVSHEDAIHYCNWLSRRDGRGPAYARAADGARWEARPNSDGYRIPSVPEWEYAFLGGALTLYPTGQDAPYLPEFAVVARTGARDTASLPPNSWGFFDLAGNLWEFCDADPDRPASQSVFCGGAYDSGSADCRSARHIPQYPGLRGPFLGFRVICRDREGLDPGSDLLRLVDLVRRLEAWQRPSVETWAVRAAISNLTFARTAAQVGFGQWDKARDTLLEQDRAIHDDPRPLAFAAVIDLRLGQPDAYRATCQVLLNRYGSRVEPGIVTSVALACLVGPAPPDVLARADGLARLAFQGLTEDNQVRGIAALAALRAGRDREALDLAGVALADNKSSPERASHDAVCLLIQALAECQLGHRQTSKMRLDEALSKGKLADASVAPSGSPRNNWIDLAIADILRAELLTKLESIGPGDPSP